MASAVARPIPFPAPRDHRHPPPSASFGESSHGIFARGPESDLIVEAFVGRKIAASRFRVCLGVPPAIGPADHRHLSNPKRGTGDIICWYEKTRLPVTNDPRKGGRAS